MAGRDHRAHPHGCDVRGPAQGVGPRGRGGHQGARTAAAGGRGQACPADYPGVPAAAAGQRHPKVTEQGWRRYEPVWSVRPVRRAFTGTLIARTAQTMLPLTILLLVRQRTGSFTEAGIAVAVSGLATVAGGPVTARLADRRGPHVLAVAGAVNAASLVLLAVTASPAVSWIAVAAAGLSVPPLTAALRATITVG